MRSGERLQDAFSCGVPNASSKDVLVSIVSDGAGSARFGGQGSSLVCRSLSIATRRHFASNAMFPSDACLEDWLDDTRDLIASVAQRRMLSMRDFAATLVFVISDGNESVISHVGDGCAVVKDRNLEKWVAPTWPDHGEYASTTSFVTDETRPRLRIYRYENPISALAVFSDGLERLALEFVNKQPFEKFLEGVTKPLRSAARAGRDNNLSQQLRLYLNSDAINSRTDDDKSLIIALRK